NLVGNEGGIAGRRRGGGPPLRCVTRSGTERAPRPRVRRGERARPSEPRRDARTNDGSRAASRAAAELRKRAPKNAARRLARLFVRPSEGRLVVEAFVLEEVVVLRGRRVVVDRGPAGRRGRAPFGG